MVAGRGCLSVFESGRPKLEEDLRHTHRAFIPPLLDPCANSFVCWSRNCMIAFRWARVPDIRFVMALIRQYALEHALRCEVLG